MEFSHAFSQDLSTIITALEGKHPFALNRFADGERMIIEGTKINIRKSHDEWDSGPTCELRQPLMDALLYTEIGYHIGFSCPCCSASDREFYKHKVNLPESRLTYSNVFVNANYDRWSQWYVNKPCVLVSSSSYSPDHLRVPKNAVQWDGIDGIVNALLADQDTAPIFVAAGPAAKVIVHRYWMRSRRDRSIVDVGSSLDPLIHRAQTRGYHMPGHPNRSKVCQWSTAESPAPVWQAASAATTLAPKNLNPAADIQRELAAKYGPRIAALMSEMTADALQLAGVDLSQE